MLTRSPLLPPQTSPATQPMSGSETGSTTQDGMFTVVELDDAETIENSAQALKTATEDVEDTMGEISTTWGGLENSYQAPEQPDLLGMMDPASRWARQLAQAGTEAKQALDTYAEALRELQTQRRQLLAAIEDFQTGDAAGDTADDAVDEAAREEKIRELGSSCQALAEAKDEAQNTCAAVLGAITTGVSTARGSEHHVPEADAAEDVEVRGQSPAEWLTEVLGLDPGEDFDGTWGSAWNQAESEGLMTTGAIADWNKFTTSRYRPRQAWAPAIVRNAASMGQRAEEFLAQTTGWDANQVIHPERRLAPDDARNPFRPVSGAKEKAKVLPGRFLASFDDRNLEANPGQEAQFSRWSRASKALSRGGGALGLITDTASQWNEDTAQHPEMGLAEQTARAGTVGISSAAGGWAGAKVGAAAGAAIGSFFPGPGTAVGAVLGGIIGGVVGSELGKKAGEAVKETAGDIADTVSEGAKDAWDSVTSLF